MDKKYKAVVIGCGKVGVEYEDDRERVLPRSHAGAIFADPRTELVALVDSNLARLRASSKRFLGVRTYRAALACLTREKPDIVVIAASTKSHMSLVRLACRLGAKIIICEKISLAF